MLSLPRNQQKTSSDTPPLSGSPPARGAERFRYITSILILASVYFVEGSLGLSLASMHHSVSLVWPPTGIALAAILLFGYRLWPGVALGAFLVNAATPVPLATAAGIALGNTLEALTGAFLLRRVAGFRNSLERPRDVVSLVGLAAGLSTTVSATLGVTSLCLGAAAAWAIYGSLWWQWWLGDAMGALVVAPFLLTWVEAARRRWAPARAVESLILLGLLIAVSAVVFVGLLLPRGGEYAITFAIFPIVMWAALRFGQCGASSTTLLVAAFAIWGTVRGTGPFHIGTLTRDLLLTQSFMSAVAVTSLLLAAAIAQRDEVEGALRSSQTRLAGILGSAMDAIVSVDAAQRIILFNRAAEQMFGWNAPEILGQPLDRLLPARFREVHAAHVSRFGQTGVTTRSMRSPGDLVALRADGQEFPIEATISQVQVDGDKLYTVMLRDITERKKAELERTMLLGREHAARAEAEAANRAKDEFLATLSHELRGPLNAILMWVQLLRGGAPDAASAARALETIERNTRALAQLIADLLDVSRIVSGKLVLEMRPVGLTPVIEAALDAVRPAAQAKDIRIDIALEGSAGPVLGDPDRLQQVVWNLLINAVKFTPKGGRVEVRLERVDSRARLVVADTGQGIRPDFLPYVFDRFRQADPSTTRAHGGLGLGLAIVRHLVEMDGGTVRGESPGEGRGATFTLELPLRAVHPVGVEVEPVRGTAGGGQAPAQAPLDGVRVLVVDDDTDSRTVLKRALTVSGAEVVTAGSPGEALAMLEWFQPDVLVSDIGMPGEDGYSLIRKVRALATERGGQVPAVALTGYARTEDRERVLSAGYQAHVAKPVGPGELVTVVARLAGSRAPSP